MRLWRIFLSFTCTSNFVLVVRSILFYDTTGVEAAGSYMEDIFDFGI